MGTNNDAVFAPPMSAPPIRLRILTVNAHKGFTAFNRRFVLHELRDAVRSVGADLVFLQEVHGTHLGHARAVPGWPKASHYEFMADQIWPAYAYGRNAVYPNGDHGNALLSKYPIDRCENHDVSVGVHEKRGLLHCMLRIPGLHAAVHAICVHFGLREFQRRRQLDALCRLVHNSVPASEPLVVAGDFNVWRRRAHRVLASGAGLTEVFVDAHGRSAKTYPAHFPLLSLDRIYVRNAHSHMPLPLPAQPWTHLSDHAPLAAEICL